MQLTSQKSFTTFLFIFLDRRLVCFTKLSIITFLLASEDSKLFHFCTNDRTH